MSQRTEGREERPTVAAKGRLRLPRWAKRRRPPEPRALRGGWGLLRYRAPQPPRRRHHAAALLLEPRGTRGSAGRDAGAERAPGERPSGRGWPRRLQGNERGAGGSPGDLVGRSCPAPAAAGSLRGERAEPPRARDAPIRDSGPPARPGTRAGWSPGRAAGWSRSPACPRASALAACPPPPSPWRRRLGNRELGPGGDRRMAASPQRAGSEGRLWSE